eukprot:EC820050.1.p1 GENE.EC820050.1~~EC820050.1.p1  ORF type:complete len:76 (+),score=40.42 EC820050.1:9-236(+)
MNKLDTGYFAMGCFWGTDWLFNQIKGVKSTSVGYSNGDLANPTYKQVCGGKTGHIEAIKVEFDPKEIKVQKKKFN